MTDHKKVAQRIKYLREVLCISEAEVAKAIGISEEEYVKAETGKTDFTFSFLQKLARFFSVDIIQLLSGDAPKLTGFQVTRFGEGISLERRKGLKHLHLASEFKDKMAEPFIVTAPFNPKDKDQPIALTVHNDQELDIVLKGSLIIRVGEYETILNEGDTIYYNANIPHGMVAEGGDCTFAAIVIKPGLDMSEVHDISTEKEAIKIADSEALFNKFLTPTLDDKGRLVNIDFHPEDNFNFAYDVIDEIANRTPDKLAMIWVSDHQLEERAFSFKDMSRLSNKAANFFLSHGIKKGDKVLMVLKRRYQFWIALLGLHKIGAIGVPATYMMKHEDYEYRIKQAGVSSCIVVSEDEVIANCEESFAICPEIKHKFAVGKKIDGWIDFDEGLEMASEELDRIETNIDDILLMYFSSGTSGYPKIITHTGRYPLGHFTTAKYWHNLSSQDLHITIADTGWAKAVWGKMYGQWLAEAALFVYDFDKFCAEDILTTLGKYGVTSLCAPPTMLRFFDLAGFENFDLSCLKHVTTAGEAMNADIANRFRKATGIAIREGFGQTESTLMIGNLAGYDIRPGSVGKPIPQYKIMLIDHEGNEVKPGEIGEIAIKLEGDKLPYGLFCEYYKDKKATSDAYKNGFYHTGDEAWKDEDGYYYYVGRRDDVIKSSGYRIGPFEVETVIMRLPYVIECAVTGVPHPTRGQAVKASIVLKKGVSPSPELIKEIQNFVKENTSPYKYPRIVEFIDQLPKTTSGKIRRVEIRNRDKNS